MTSFGHLRREVMRTLRLLQSPALTHQRSRVLSRNATSFIPKRVLILSKVSRYYFEKMREPDISEDELRMKLLSRGSDYDAMLTSHHNNKETEVSVTRVLKDLNIEYRVMNRLSIDHNSFNWADLVLPIGGDGTFLLASNLIYDNAKPIMGINSDPLTSEGFLMLPPNDSKNIPHMFERLRAGEYDFLMRSRIRIILKGEGIWSTPFHMHEKCRLAGEERYTKFYTDKDTAMENNYVYGFYVNNYPSKVDASQELPKERRLPWLALNEVFIGESLSARTSSLHIKVGDDPTTYKIKSSGLCASTGTGSTSWHRAINSLSPQVVNDILRTAVANKTYTDEEARKICVEFNKRLQFPAEDLTIGYTIRDMIVADTWPTPKGIQPRGNCKTLTIQSHCFDAGLVLDGGIAVPFNDGTVAILSVHPEDALRTMVLP